MDDDRVMSDIAGYIVVYVDVCVDVAVARVYVCVFLFRLSLLSVCS